MLCPSETGPSLGSSSLTIDEETEDTTEIDEEEEDNLREPKRTVANRRLAKAGLVFVILKEGNLTTTPSAAVVIIIIIREREEGVRTKFSPYRLRGCDSVKNSR